MHTVAEVAWKSFSLRANGNDGGLTYEHALAKARGLVRKLNRGRLKYDTESGTLTPTYESKERSLNEVRRLLHDEISSFIKKARFRERAGITAQTDEPQVFARRVTTGVGKTTTVIKVVSADIKEAARKNIRQPKPWIFFVPTHRLGEEIAEKFLRQGLYARVFRGRSAPVGSDKNGPKMCDNLEQVEIAIKCHATVATSCCKSKERTCKYYDKCRYQAQLRERPDVWICAHGMLFYGQEEIGEVGGVVIDESFWSAGLKLGTNIKLSDLSVSPIGKKGKEQDFAALHQHRCLLTTVLSKQKNDGGISCRTLVGSNNRERPPKSKIELERARERENELNKMLDDNLTGDVLSALSAMHKPPLLRISPTEPVTLFSGAERCTEAIKLEWELIPDPKIVPGMSRSEFERAKEAQADIARARQMIGIWENLRETIAGYDISGGVRLETNERGDRILKTNVVRPIHKQWKDAPTLILDATLPDSEILKAFYANVMLGAELEAEMPHTYVRQIIKSPTTATKLESDKNKSAVRRYILERWIATERQKTLVVCQQKYEHWLKGAGLPESIHVEHYNAIEGLNSYKDVRLLVLVGRAIPGPRIAEEYAGALSGKEPLRLKRRGNNDPWYPSELRVIRMRNGTGVGVNSDFHPDTLVESVRRQLHEAKAMQAVGRARAVNRTQNTPLDIDILGDVVLPLTVDEAMPWEGPSPAAEMAVEGLVLVSGVNGPRKSPQFWACNFPHFGGVGDQPVE